MSTPQLPQSVPGPKILLLGQPGAGKTSSIATLIKAGIECFCIFTEPGMGPLLDRVGKLGADTSKLHWRYIPPAAPSFTTLIDNARKINTLNQSVLQKMDGLNRQDYGQFIEFVSCLANFTDQDGKEFGSVDSWDASRALIVDSWSGINTMAMDLIVGAKPIKSMADWGMAMDNISKLMQKLCGDTRCFIIVTGHLEGEQDPITGRIEQMLSTLGKKLAPTIPRMFDECVYAYQEAGNFYWSTSSANINTKARMLPIADKQRPDFAPIVEAWRRLSTPAPVPA